MTPVRLLVPLLLASAQAADVQVFKLPPFSPDYSATVTVKGDLKNIFSLTFVRVYNKAGKQLFEVEIDDVAYRLKNGYAVPDKLEETPYGEEGALIYRDFNFDGRKDLAILSGNYSCNHGPSYEVYLGVPGGFRPSPSFTRLAQEYCGMFYVDAAKKQLETKVKSGCCSTQTNTFSVVDGKPLLVKSVEEGVPDWSRLYWTERVSVRQGGKLVAGKTKLMYTEPRPSPTLMYFPLKNNPRKAVFLLLEEDLLDYAFVDDYADTVELSLRAEDAAAGRTKPTPLVYDVKAGRLTFRNKGVTYAVVDTPARFGVEVTVGGKTTFLAGDRERRGGRLTELKGLKLKNLVVKP